MPRKLKGYAPWIGENYAEGFDGLRLLIVGDSHYECDEESVFDKQNYTTECVNYWVLDKTRKTPAFWKRLTEVVQTALAPHSTQADIWQRLAFANFIPHPMERARAKPSASDFRDGEECFQRMLDSLPAPPDLVLVASIRCYEWMPYDKEAGFKNIESDPRRDRAYRLGNSWMAAIRHPSSPSWHQVPSNDAKSVWGSVLKELAEISRA